MRGSCIPGLPAVFVAVVLFAPPPPAAAQAPAWVQLAPPASVGLHVLDTRRDREIFFDEQGLLAVPDRSPIEWQRIWSGVNPASHANDFAVYDSLQDRIWTVSRSLRDTLDLWSMDLSSDPLEWTRQNYVWSGPGIGTNRVVLAAALAFDPIRNRIVTYGGVVPPTRGFCDFCEVNTIYSLTLSGTPTWKREIVEGVVPARGSAAMVHDPWRDRMIVYGGVTFGPIYYDQTYALTMGSPMRWSVLNSIRLPPSGHSPIVTTLLDHESRRWIMDGSVLDLSASVPDDVANWSTLPSAPDDYGSSSNAWFEQREQSRILKYDGNNIFALPIGSTPAWTLLEEIGRLQSPRLVSFVDAAQQRIYAGLGSGQGLSNTFKFRPLDRDQPWSLVPTNAPSSRTAALAGIDAAARRALVFAGGNGSEQLSDLWSFDFDTREWRLLSPGNPPIKRAEAVGMFDSKRRRLIVHGGRYTNPSSVALNDTWVFDAVTENWSPASAGSYGGQWAEIGIYDPVRDRVITIGGASSENVVHVLPLEPAIGQWAELPTVGNAPFVSAASHAAAYDSLGDRMVIVGQKGTSTGVWALTLSDPPTWSEITPQGNPPPSPNGAQLVSDPARGRFLLVGGSDDWALYLHEVSPGSLVGYDVQHDAVTLRWHTVECVGSAIIDRRDSGDWQEVGTEVPNGSGIVTWVDRTVVPGASYDYRLRVFSSQGERVFAETHVDVPKRVEPQVHSFSLEGVRPNPTNGSSLVAFSLAESGRTTIELIDLAGRRVLYRDLGLLTAGPHSVRLDEGRSHPPPGLYFVRLHHSGRTLSAKAALLE
jgi:hypothetical protein